MGETLATAAQILECKHYRVCLNTSVKNWALCLPECRIIFNPIKPGTLKYFKWHEMAVSGPLTCTTFLIWFQSRATEPFENRIQPCGVSCPVYSVFQHVLCINLKPHGAESQLHAPSKSLKRSLLLHGLFGSWPICFRCQTISMQPKIDSLSKCSYTWRLIPFILTQQLVGLSFTCTWSWITKKMLCEWIGSKK